jgi:hypothetical protein
VNVHRQTNPHRLGVTPALGLRAVTMAPPFYRFRLPFQESAPIVQAISD